MDGVIDELREYLTHGHNIATREKVCKIVESLVRDLETDDLDQVTGKVQVLLLVVQSQSCDYGKSTMERCKYLDVLMKESRAILQFCKVTGSKYCNTGGDIMLSLTSLFKHTYQNIKELINELEDVSSKLSATEDCNIYLNTLDNMSSLTKMLFSIDIMATVNIWKAFKRSEMDGEMDVHQEYYLCTKTDQEHQTNKTDMLTACEILMLWCQAGLYQKLPELLEASPGKVKTFEDIVYIAQETSKKIEEVIVQNDHQSLEKLQKVFRFFINTFMFLKEMKKELNKEELKSLYALLLSMQKYLIQSIQEWINFSSGEMNVKVEEGSCREIFETFCSSHTPLLHALIEEFVRHKLAPAVFLEELQHDDIGTNQLVLLTNVMEKISQSVGEVTEVWMFNGDGTPNIFDIMFHCINNIEQEVFINQQIDGIFLYEYLLKQTCALCSTLTNKHFQILVVDSSNMDSDTTKVQQQLTFLFQRLFWFLPDEFHKNAVKCLEKICHKHQLYELLPVELTDSIAQQIEDFWRCFESVEGSMEMFLASLSTLHLECFEVEQICFSFLMDEELFLRMLELTIAIMPTLAAECMKMILSVVNKLIKHLENSTFLLFCCEMLSSLKYVKFTDNNQNQCLSMMATIFNNLLTHENFIIQCYAMQALKEFAEVTPYTKALVEFLPPTKKKEFALFLKKALPNGQIFDTVEGKLELYGLISKSNNCHHVEIDLDRPYNEHKLKEALQVLSADVENIRNLVYQSPGRPPWLNCEIQKVIESLQDLRNENT